MRLADRFSATGDVMFRWRSWLPLLLLPLFLASFLGYPGGSQGLDLGWELAYFSVSALGMAVRLFTTGTAPRGTSGRNTREQKATVLNTTGPYSIVRHPLYLSNLVIIVALCLTYALVVLPIFLKAKGFL